MSRLLFLDQFSELGGAQRCLLDLLPAFIAAGHEAHVAVPEGGAFAEIAASFGCVAHAIPCGPYQSGQKSYWDAARFAADFGRQACRIASLVAKHRIELIYVNGPRLLPAAAIGAGGRPVVFHSHSIVTQRTAARLARWALGSMNAHVIAACRFVQRHLRAPVPIGRSRVIYNGIAPVRCIRRQRSNNQPLRIGIIGRIAPEKGQLEFVQAARIVLQKHNCEFVVCGEPLFSSPHYNQQVRSLAAGLPINFLGWRDDLDTVLSTLDLLVVPSATLDATPLVILEAFSAGVPVIAFPSGGIPEIIEDGVTGVLCPPTVSELASRLSDFVSRGGAALDTLAERAQKTFAARFSLERYRSEVLDVVRHATAESNFSY